MEGTLRHRLHRDVVGDGGDRRNGFRLDLDQQNASGQGRDPRLELRHGVIELLVRSRPVEGRDTDQALVDQALDAFRDGACPDPVPDPVGVEVVGLYERRTGQRHRPADTDGHGGGPIEQVGLGRQRTAQRPDDDQREVGQPPPGEPPGRYVGQRPTTGVGASTPSPHPRRLASSVRPAAGTVRLPGTTRRETLITSGRTARGTRRQVNHRSPPPGSPLAPGNRSPARPARPPGRPTAGPAVRRGSDARVDEPRPPLLTHASCIPVGRVARRSVHVDSVHPDADRALAASQSAPAWLGSRARPRCPGSAGPLGSRDA